MESAIWVCVNGSRSVGNATAQYNAIGDRNHHDFITFVSDARKRCDRSERVENCGDAFSWLKFRK